MTATTQPAQPTHQPPAATNPPVQQPVQEPGDVPLFSRTRMASHIFGGLARISLGWVFLWAFLDKTFGLGYATEPKDAWIDGGSPTFGFLSFGATGPFKGIYNSIAGDAWADWLFMLGLLATLGAGRWLGFGRKWEQTTLVQKVPVLR